MLFNSVEDAYMTLANYVQAFIGVRQWSEAGCHMRILGQMARGSQWLTYNNIREEHGGFESNQNIMWDGLDAALFLRDNLLTATGDRIWGLVFTLYPDGKFKIEYDYNKPEEYEESEDTITLEDAMKGLLDSGIGKE